MPTVIVPQSYQGPTRGQGEIEVEGRTVLECLEAVEAEHTGFLPQVLDGHGKPHKFVKLFVNEEPVEGPVRETPVEAGDRVEVIAAIAGG